MADMIRASRKAEKALNIANDACRCGNPDGCVRCDKYRDAINALRKARSS